jgi:ketosteroid isomerase-like protein
MLSRFSSTRIFMLLLVLAAVALPAIAAVHRQHQKRATRDTVESMEEQWRLAQLNGDVSAMDRLLSDDFVGITAFGQVTTKAQQLARLQDRTIVLTQLELTDIKVKLIGPIVAVVTSRAEVKGTSDGAPIDGAFRYTRVYQRTVNGMWKITSLEATPARGEGGGKTHSDTAEAPSNPHP